VESGRFTDRAQKVLELSLREALQLGHAYIGTEHILLALIREGDGVAAKVLGEMGDVRRAVIAELARPSKPTMNADIETLRKFVLSHLDGYQAKEALDRLEKAWGSGTS
jgi:ATP-dependent Clp protease ATP-binding subunit ClpC